MNDWKNSQIFHIISKLLLLCLFCGITIGCSDEVVGKIVSPNNNLELTLGSRSGSTPSVPSKVPHQQLDQNSPDDILDKLETFLFSLEHVEEQSSSSSFASARGAVIKSGVETNSAINREFTHIHMEPGPGSQHLTLLEDDSKKVLEGGWGVIHPWNDRLAEKGYVLMMIYAPRNNTDLEEVKKIIQAAHSLVLKP